MDNVEIMLESYPSSPPSSASAARAPPPGMSDAAFAGCVGGEPAAETTARGRSVDGRRCSAMEHRGRGRTSASTPVQYL